MVLQNIINHVTSLDSFRIDLPNQRGDLLGLQLLFGQDDLNYEIAGKSDENQSAHCNLVLYSALEIHPSECGRTLGKLHDDWLNGESSKCTPTDS